MKIRIQDNSIRVRVSLEELTHLFLGHSIVMETPLATGSLLTKVMPADHETTVKMSNNELSITINKDKLNELSFDEIEGFEASIKINDNAELLVLFQKDYVCIGRSDASNKGLFPNPKLKNGTC